MVRRLRATVAAALAVLAAAAGAWAAPPTIDLKPTFGGGLTLGQWQPVTVTLTNPVDGEALIGEAQVVLEDPYTEQALAIFSRRLSLPPGAATAETTLQVFVPDGAPPEFVVNVLRSAPDGTPSADVVTRRRFDKIPVQPGASLRVLAVAPLPDALSYLEGERLPVYRNGGALQPALPAPGNSAAARQQQQQRRRYGGGGGGAPEPVPAVVQTVVVTEPGRLPDRATGYDSIAVVYLGGMSPDAFSDAQVEALRAYAQSGGVVVVGQRGTRLRQDERFRALAPPLTGQETAWRRVGRGWVATLPFDAAAPDFAARAAEAKAFWERLALRAVAPPRLGAYLEAGDSWYASSFADAVVFAPGLRAPSPAWFGGFMLAYLLLVAPVNYFVLKRLGRREWTWLTVPALVAAFSFGAYRIGFATKGTSLYQNVTSLVELGPDSGAASVVSYVGLFSPARARYDIQADAPDALLFEPQGRRRYSSGGGGNAPSFGVLTVDQDARPGSQARDADVPMWAMRVFGVRTSSLTVGDGVRVRVRREGSRLVGTVENRTKRVLEEVTIFGEGGRQNLGALAPGQTVAVRYASDPDAERLRLESALMDSARRRRSGRRSTPPSPAADGKPADRDKRLRDAMMERMSFSIGQIIEEQRVREFAARRSPLAARSGGAVLPPPEVTVTAWNADPLLPVRVDGKAVEQGAHLNLLLVRAPVGAK